MLNRKLSWVIVFLLVVGLGFYLFLKSKTPKTSADRVYTHEKVTESGGNLVEGFPSVPVYQGLTLDKSYKREQDGKTDFNAFWYYDAPEGKAIEIMKWYVDELKKAGWKVTGPYIDESENELGISAENSKYNLRLYNSERYEGEAGGPPGKVIAVDIKEK